MLTGCNVLVWLLMLTPLVVVAVLFVVSPWLGAVGFGILVVAIVLYLGGGFLLTRRRECCPGCREKKLKWINAFLANRPPNYTFYRCEGCGREYVRVDGEAAMTEREESRFKNSPGWDVEGRVGGKRGTGPPG